MCEQPFPHEPNGRTQQFFSQSRNYAIYILIWGLFIRMSRGINFRWCVKFPNLLFPEELLILQEQVSDSEVQSSMAVDLKGRHPWSSSLSSRIEKWVYPVVYLISEKQKLLQKIFNGKDLIVGKCFSLLSIAAYWAKGRRSPLLLLVLWFCYIWTRITHRTQNKQNDNWATGAENNSSLFWVEKSCCQFHEVHWTDTYCCK